MKVEQQQIVEPALKVQMELDAHEKECAMFRELVHGKLDGLDKRMWRLEAMIMASTLGVVALIATLLMKLG
jgi:hypothetical protein